MRPTLIAAPVGDRAETVRKVIANLRLGNRSTVNPVNDNDDSDGPGPDATGVGMTN